MFFFFSSRRRHTRYWRDWSSDVCSSDLRHVALAVPWQALSLDFRPLLARELLLRINNSNQNLITCWASNKYASMDHLYDTSFFVRETGSHSVTKRTVMTAKNRLKTLPLMKIRLGFSSKISKQYQLRNCLGEQWLWKADSLMYYFWTLVN